MRIIYLHQYFNTPRDPGGTRSYEVGRRLVAAGHHVEMVSTWRGATQNRGWFVTEEEGMQVHWLPLPYSNQMSYSERMRAFATFALRAGHRAASLPGDVVYATSTPLTIALPGAYVARRKHIPMVFEVRDLWPQVPIAVGALDNPILRFGANKLEHFAYAHAARVIALSPGIRAGVARLGFPADKIEMIPNAADLETLARDDTAGLEWRERHRIPRDRIVFGYTGTFGKMNQVSYLARLAAKMKHDKRFFFVAVGDGSERASIERLAVELGILNRNFMMLPSVPKQEMGAVLSGIDVASSLFLPIPEAEANCANKFFDALSAGCCVAVNYGGWQAEILRESGAGIQLPATPANAGAELAKLADSPGSIERAGRCARRLAEERFARDLLVPEIEGVLCKAITGGMNPAGPRASPLGPDVESRSEPRQFVP